MVEVYIIMFFCFYFEGVVQILDSADFQLYSVRKCHSSLPVRCFPVAVLAQFNNELVMPSLKAVSRAGGYVCCALHITLCCADHLPEKIEWHCKRGSLDRFGYYLW